MNLCAFYYLWYHHDIPWSFKTGIGRWLYSSSSKNSYQCSGQCARDRWCSRLNGRQEGRNCSAWIFHGWALAQCGYHSVRWLHHIVRHWPPPFIPLCVCANGSGHLWNGGWVQSRCNGQSHVSSTAATSFTEIPEVTWTFPIYGTS